VKRIQRIARVHRTCKLAIKEIGTVSRINKLCCPRETSDLIGMTPVICGIRNVYVR